MAFFARKEAAGPQVMSLPVSSIVPNPHQPRRTFAPAELEELSRSIAQVGILQPLTVRSVEAGWELIAGERRLRAAILAGLQEVPCLITEADESRSSLLALVENIQRQDLDFWEEAMALDKLIKLCQLSQEEAARRIGKSQSSVANKLRLEDPKAQRDAAEHILKEGLNVAQTDAYVERLLTPKQRSCKPTYLLKDVRLFLNTLQRGMSIMNAAGIKSRCDRQETEQEILLTIHIPKARP